MHKAQERVSDIASSSTETVQEAVVMSSRQWYGQVNGIVSICRRVSDRKRKNYRLTDEVVRKNIDNKIMFKRTRSLSNAIYNTHKIFLSERSWMTYKFRVTWSHNSTCISSHIEDNGPQPIGVTTSTCQVTWRFLSHDHLIPQVPFPIDARL